jgi:hypothetical protein
VARCTSSIRHAASLSKLGTKTVQTKDGQPLGKPIAVSQNAPPQTLVYKHGAYKYPGVLLGSVTAPSAPIECWHIHSSSRMRLPGRGTLVSRLACLMVQPVLGKVEFR